MKKTFLSIITLLILAACVNQVDKDQTSSDDQNFTFIFATDIHLTTERNATEGFLQAIDSMNALKPDFILTGGDNIMDALGQTYAHSDSAYSLFSETAKHLNMPLYSTLGNHEVFGLYEKSGIDPSHEEYGKKMYEKRIGKRYYSFDHKNWHFIVLDGIGITENRHYYGHVDEEQIEWLKKDLEQTGKERQVAVSIHIPLLSVGQQIMAGPTAGFSAGEIVTNALDVIKILEQYNTKLVLQGHLHFLEDIQFNGIHYITGGAVSAQWWNGPRYGMEEGFLRIDVKGEEFSWRYVDYNWEVKPKETAEM